MALLLSISAFLVSIVFIKFTIDTNATIKQLKKDKDLFRNALWNYLYHLEKTNKVNDFAYQNIKKRIDVLINDINETDFNNFDGDAKNELISALKEIDFYGDINNDKN